MSKRKNRQQRARTTTGTVEGSGVLEKHSKDLTTYAAYFVLLFRLLVLFSRAVDLPFHT